MKFDVTVHTIVKNEDRWIWYGLMSVIDHVKKIIIYDTGSTDKTIKIIKTINSPKIILEKKKRISRDRLVKLRQEQLDRTTTPWFMLLDGDEIWPEKNLKKLFSSAIKSSPKTLALFSRTRNCVGDVFHFLPDSKGNYRIKDKVGHLNIRLIRNANNLNVSGKYPLEAFSYRGVPLQKLEDKIEFVDTWYLHTTHLPRSTQPNAEKEVIDRINKRKFRLGQKMTKAQLPQILWQPRPPLVPPPPTKPWNYFFSFK